MIGPMAVYDDARFLNVVVRMTAKNATVWAGETWQVGLRCAVKSSPGFGTSAGRVELPKFGVQDAAVSRTSGRFDIEQGFSGVSGLTWVLTDQDCDSVAEFTEDWLAAIKAHTSLYFVLDSIRLYPTGADGKTRTAPTVYKPKTTAGNPSGLKMLPADCALTVSWGSATRGPKGRGRIFLGAPTASEANEAGMLTTPARDAIAAASANWLDDLRSIGGLSNQASITPIIWHRPGDKSGQEDGTFGSVISAVRVNDHYDTQRRRDRQVAPAWKRVDLS